MEELKIFSNEEFGDIRTLQENGKVLFVATDVAKALKYATPRDAINRHCKGVVKRDTPTSGGIQSISYIYEGDLYRLITHSKLPRAQEFESWVFDEVLPSIRKNGGYIAGQETMSDTELIAKALLVAQKKIEEKEQLLAMQDSRIQEMRPKEIFADAVATSHTSILIRDLAKLLRQNGVEIGQNRLFEWLRDKGYLIKNGISKNMPSQRSMEMGLFKVKEGTYVDGTGANVTTRTTVVTGKGQIYFINKFLEGNAV